MGSLVGQAREDSKRWRWLAIVLVLVLVAAACGDDDDATAGDGAAEAGDSAPASDGDNGGDGGEESPTDSAGECPQKGGQLTMGSGTLAAAVDPNVALGTGSSGGTELTAMYDTLMRYIPDTGEYVPNVAESLTSNEELTEWTLTLKPGITFGNGDPLTTDAVQFSIERIAGSARSAAGLAQEIVGFDIVDDLTIVLTTRSPNGTIPYTLSTESGMVLNPKLVNERGEEFANDPTGAGVGPFELERFAPGEEIVLAAKDDYWGGEVCLDTLRFISVAGGQATWDAFRSGEMDVAFLSDMTVINQARDAGNEAHSSISGGNAFFMLNNREGFATHDPRVRQAVSYALDTELIDSRVVEGEGLPTSCLVHPNQLIHPDVECPAYDPDRARELVDEAKADGWDGNINLVFRDAPLSVENSIVLEGLLTDVGMTVERLNVDIAQWSERVLTPPYDFDVGEYGLALLDAGPIARMNQFFSDSVRNRSGYGSAEMDALLAELAAALTVEEITEIMGRIQEVWNRDIPSVVVNASEWFLAAQDKVKGLEFNRDVTALFQHAYIDG